MSGDGTDDVNIPLVFLFSGDAEILLKALEENSSLKVALSDYPDDHGNSKMSSLWLVSIMPLDYLQKWF